MVQDARIRVLIARPYVFRENLRPISREPIVARESRERFLLLLLLRKIDYTLYVHDG